MTRRGRSGYVDNAPGRLFKYMSAGGVERSSDNYDNDHPRPRSTFPVYLAAFILFIIWLIF